MNKFLLKKVLLSVLLFSPILLTCLNSSPDFSHLVDLPQLFQENERILELNEYKDTNQILESKFQNLAIINKSRKENGLKPLVLDILASRVANKHCQEMVQHNYMSHWNIKGEKPYHRYAFYSGTDAIAENIFNYYTTDKFDSHFISQYMQKGHNIFMAEKPPNDGHRKNILDHHHNAVGIGCYLSEKGFAYAQEFLNKYIKMDPFPRRIQSGKTVTLIGNVLMKKLYPFLLLVFYEPPLNPMSVNELKQTYSYPDFTETEYKSIWNQFWFDKKTRKFKIELPFKEAKPGLYYVKIYLSKKKGNIYSSKDGFSATSIVIEVK